MPNQWNLFCKKTTIFFQFRRQIEAPYWFSILNSFWNLIFQFGTAIFLPNWSFFVVIFFLLKNQYGASIYLRKWFFILQFCKKLKINMDQLFAFQIDAFSPRAQHGCELYANTMKRKALGSLFGAQICALRSKGVKNASSTLMFNKGFAKFATSRLPCRKSANLDNK